LFQKQLKYELTAERNRAKGDEDGPHEYERDGQSRDVNGRPASIVFNDIEAMSLHDVV
jgi:hypothetical protein